MPNADDAQVSATPLALEDLDHLFACLHSVSSVVLAVSGGADSMALMVLMAKWRNARHPDLELYVASVDHGLRAEALDECAFVKAQASQLGLPHLTLKWSPSDAMMPNLQAQARRARYALLTDYAVKMGSSHLVVAHHLEDQAETVLMRLMRGSGLRGLSAMRTESELDGICLLRPLLSVSKHRLKASLVVENVGWIDDPSNLNEDYLRVRIRGLLPQFENEGCDAERLASTARRMQRADLALDAVTQQLIDEHVACEPGRALSFPVAWYGHQLEELRLRLLRAIIDHVAAGAYPPREDRLMALDAALVQASGVEDTEKTAAVSEAVKRTFAGCCFAQVGMRIWVYRELGRQLEAVELRVGQPISWQGLYDVCLDSKLDNVTLRPLGQDGRVGLAKSEMLLPLRSCDGEVLPKVVIEAMLSIWHEGRPVAVVDWPEIAINSGIRVDFRGKRTRFTNNQGLA